jgi:hypothetical protein
MAGAIQAISDFISALIGEKNEPGLIADISTIKNWGGVEIKKERLWLTRLVVGVVIVEVLGLLLAFLI